MLSSSFAGRSAWLSVGVTILIGAQPTWAQTAPAPAPPEQLPPSGQPIPAKTSTRIAEGTEVRVRLDETLSSKTSAVGDEFGIVLDEPVQLPDGTVIPAGYRGKGSVTAVHKVEMMGKAGELNVRLDSLRIGDVRVHLRGNQGGEGKSMQSTAIALSLVVSPLFLLRHGHDMVIPKGQHITAYVDDDTAIPLPLAPPPMNN